MDTGLLRAFQRETLEQCTYVRIAAHLLNQLMSADSYEDMFWRELQNFVVGTANVSKLLWGQRGKYAKQRKPLRESIKVGDSSPLRPTTMRNHFEHIDERLDEWWAKSGTRNQADRSVGPPGMFVGLKEKEFFRSFDPSTGIASFWGDDYDMKSIIEEVNRIYPLLEAEATKPHWQA